MNNFARVCGQCAFFHRQMVGQPAGTCRRHPPLPIMVGAITEPGTNRQYPNIQTFWPQVPDTAGCGDWVKAPSPLKFHNEPEVAGETVQ